MLRGFLMPVVSLLGTLALPLPARSAPTTSPAEIVVTQPLTLERGAMLTSRLIVRASHITLDGNGATLVGPGRVGEPASLESAGVGILIEGATGVTLTNIRVHGFATGLVIRDAEAILVTDSDFSENYDNPQHGWDELPPRGGIVCQRVSHSVIRQNRANRVWNALDLVDSDDNLAEGNDFSHCANTCARLWHSSRNRFLNNNLSYGLRIDRAAGEVHARDSTGVLVETGSDDNYWYRNDITHGGDGIFIRPLNRWVSTGNVFVENDASYANNNCVESWSPGNTFIRNRANHGSYGFWLGGSDHTVLIGNEAAFNGLTNGFHNAPEAGFGHGGIVIVGGPSSHTRIEGNDLHDNGGAGIAFRGDVESKGRAWRTEHWIIQQNRIANNRFGIWGRWGDAILLAANVFANNAEGNDLRDVANLIELPTSPSVHVAPRATVVGPDVVHVGQKARFEARLQPGTPGGSTRFHWWLEAPAGEKPVLERVFDRPGFERLGLTVDNGALAGLAWRDLLVVAPVARELGTEGQADRWGFELEGNDDGRGRIRFTDDPQGIVGRQCLRFTPDPYPGAYATVIYPATRDAGWDFTGKESIRFWIKTRNPNLPGYQNAGPVVRLLSARGHIEYKPSKDGNLLNDPPFSEGRWLWMPVAIPLAGDDHWQKTTSGDARRQRINALSISLDSWGGDPFTVWVDGLTVE